MDKIKKEEFLDSLKEIVKKAEKDADFLDSIVDDVSDLLDEYDNDSEDDEEY